MNAFTMVTVIIAIIGTAVVGGVFFAFSSFIMKALARLPASEGIAAMQSINIVVLNPVFLGVFMGTSAVSLLILAIAIKGWELPSAPYLLTGGLLYFVGTFLVTGLGNVPLNNQLASIGPTDPASSDIWQHYLERWTRLNTLRTMCSIAATLVLIIGLINI
jgi:uncharacterized membrane protein